MNIRKTRFGMKAMALFAASFLFVVGSAHALEVEHSPWPSELKYVAIGDSLTTGSSVATCLDDRQNSPWGCSENPTVAMSYPDRIVSISGGTFSDQASDYIPGHFNSDMSLYRAGIWGYTVQEAAEAQRNGHNTAGDWMPQLQAISRATTLVTGNLGINDLHFSDVTKWAKLYFNRGPDQITPEVKRILTERSADFDQLFDAYKQARLNGAKVITTLYYNPYDSNQANCRELQVIGKKIVNALDDELNRRANNARLDVVDFRQYFSGHGAGSDDPYVFGKHCSLGGAFADLTPTWLGGGGGRQALAVNFDPHPNNAGTQIMAKQILEKYNGSD